MRNPLHANEVDIPRGEKRPSAKRRGKALHLEDELNSGGMFSRWNIPKSVLRNTKAAHLSVSHNSMHQGDVKSIANYRVMTMPIVMTSGKRTFRSKLLRGFTLTPTNLRGEP